MPLTPPAVTPLLHRPPVPAYPISEVAEVLNTSSAQVYALVRRGELKAIKIGGRGQWRVETSKLEEYIQKMYDEADEFVSKHPFVEARTGNEDSADDEPT
jgi:excisionase family DNA binding protein